ncbi:MAG: hypothetical protein ACT4QG_21105 [Sporichthyaceae bacterium]
MKSMVKLTAATVAVAVAFVALSTITSPSGASATTVTVAPKTKVVVTPKARTVAKQARLTTTQLRNARTIVAIAVDRKLPKRAAVIAVATAMQESSLRNLYYGDRDSLGLFQQRPSSGWGTPGQVTDPQYATHTFLTELQKVPRWKTRPLTEAAQKVQRSAYPNAYARWEPLAQKLTTAMIQHPRAAEKPPAPKKVATFKPLPSAGGRRIKSVRRPTGPSAP